MDVRGLTKSQIKEFVTLCIVSNLKSDLNKQKNLKLKTDDMELILLRNRRQITMTIEGIVKDYETGKKPN